jgi:hypothetical protein
MCNESTGTLTIPKLSTRSSDGPTAAIQIIEEDKSDVVQRIAIAGVVARPVPPDKPDI